VIRPSAEERAQLERLSRLLEDAIPPGQGEPERASGERITLDFASRERGAAADDRRGAGHESVELPRAAVAALLEIARALAQGQTLHLVPHGADLTTQAAADLLGVSRPHLIKLIDQGDIACHMVGTHRRLLSDDVLAYRERRNASRRSGVQEIQRLSAELEGDY
jgi:excisionase family DNA binding protein